MTTSADREELLRKEEFNFALFQHHPAPMTVVDRQGRVVKSNLARRRIQAPLPDLGVVLFAPDGDDDQRRLQESLAECIADGCARHVGEYKSAGRILDLSFSPFPDGAIVISPDITERKQAEEEARTQREQLIRAQKLASIGMLVSGVAHEVSNPNNALLLSASALSRVLQDLLRALDRIEESDGQVSIGNRPYAEARSEALEQIDIIQRAARRIQGTVAELKDYARAETRDKAGPVDVNAVVRNACSLLGASVRKATRRFVMELQEPLPTVIGSAQRLEQVVVNLLTNACQALEDAGQAISVRTSYDPGSGRVAVTVSDEGRGIPEDTMAHIKDPFFTTKHDSGGTGLGLSVSDKIAAAHGGFLEFVSCVGKGTTAILYLPAGAAAAEPVSQP